MDSGESPLALAAFVISIFGTLVALAALIWNIKSWRRSGPHLFIELSVGDYADDTFVGADIYNVGRSPVDIVQVDIAWWRDGERNVCSVYGWDDGPCKLEAGSVRTFEYDAKPGDKHYSADAYEAICFAADRSITRGRQERWEYARRPDSPDSDGKGDS